MFATFRGCSASPWRRSPWYERPQIYVCSNLFSNFCLVGKLWEARSRPYKRQILQVNICKYYNNRLNSYLVRKEDWEKRKARDKIYKIDTLLLRSTFKISATSHQRFSRLRLDNFIFKNMLDCLKFANLDETYPEFQHLLQKRAHLLVSNFLRFGNRNCQIFQDFLQNSRRSGNSQQFPEIPAKFRQICSEKCSICW